LREKTYRRLINEEMLKKDLPFDVGNLKSWGRLYSIGIVDVRGGNGWER